MEQTKTCGKPNENQYEKLLHLRYEQALMTRLGTFLRDEHVVLRQLSRRAGCSRQHLYRLRHGLQEPTRPMMQRITRACTQLLQRRVRLAELFEVEP